MITSPSRSVPGSSLRASMRFCGARRIRCLRQPRYRCGDLTIDFGRFEAARKGTAIDLTALEFKLLRALISRGGTVVTHDDLIAEVWGRDVFLTDRVIYTHINNLRRKIEVDPANPALIIGVRGVGYRFNG